MEFRSTIVNFILYFLKQFVFWVDLYNHEEKHVGEESLEIALRAAAPTRRTKRS